ncbi:thiamine/thiamine pyrophosphate ABC transporter permease ThiP [Halovulum sp. GXIMD14793]
MASGPEPLSSRMAQGTGWAVLGLVLALSFGSALVLLGMTPDGGLRRGLGSAEWAAIRFTLFQALLSALLSCALAIPLARALMRRRFAGRTLLITLLGAPFLLPAIVTVTALLTIWGRAGLISQGVQAMGGPPLSIYGLPGILLAHVFFNLPLATRLLIQGWQSVPSEQFRLVAQLGMGPGAVLRFIEWPILRNVLPGAFVLVFLLCMTSFAIVLTLGGGPSASTIELSIYQALRFDFDPSAAARLALVQFAICGSIALIILRIARPLDLGARFRPPERWDRPGGWRLAADTGLILGVILFLGVPLAMLAICGGPALLDGLPAGIWSALGLSITIAITSALLSAAMALALAALILRLGQRAAWGAEAVGLIMLAASPFVIGTALFVVLNPLVSPFAMALPVTGLINAVMSLPFALRAMLPALAGIKASHGRLADSLGVSGWNRWRLVLWPGLRRPLGFSAGLAAALSAGDLGVITLFAPPGVETLPLYMYNLMGAYRTEDAAGAALVLLLLSLSLFALFDIGGRTRADT